MRFLFRILPLVFFILFGSLIYFGGKKIFAFIDANRPVNALSHVTESLSNDYDDETYSGEETLADVNDLGLNSQENYEDGTHNLDDSESDLDFDEDFEKEDLDSPEASLDAELEGKSSNQLIAAAAEKKDKLKEKIEAKSKKNTEFVKKKTNERPSKNELTTKGNIPTSYDTNSEGAQFLVIAGSFKSKDNAHIFVDDLEKKGLKNIEIIEMKNKNLNRVCVSRHASYEAAKEVISQLKKDHRVDAYVHRKTN